ncbi:hypothetical protein BB561_006361 [Smittium simulii]|uniref:Uncharacterized protein n=1 Tax=Smittium simulii TaxID=133385 RepID=A0A2T9Y507_9FUNG|nr:hypothetical protein BB561_006361 [Smittium simulii]
MLANKSVLLVFLLTQTLVQGYLANSNIKETKEFEISKREQVDSYQNSETFDNGLGGITKCNANGCYTVPSDSTIANSDFYSNILSKRYNSGKYVPDNRGKYVPDNRGKYVPDNRGKYVPDNRGKYVPDNRGKYVPSNKGKYVHSNKGKYVPSNKGKYVSDNRDKYFNDSDPDFDVRSL